MHRQQLVSFDQNNDSSIENEDSQLEGQDSSLEKRLILGRPGQKPWCQPRYWGNTQVSMNIHHFQIHHLPRPLCELILVYFGLF